MNTCTWVYIQSEPRLYTVGFYDPNGEWHTDSDHGSKQEAADRVHYLNGGNDESEESPAETIRKNADANRWSK